MRLRYGEKIFTSLRRHLPGRLGRIGSPQMPVTPPFIIYCYLDDIFGLWEKSETEFHHLIHILNSHHPRIKLKHTLHLQQVPFLDTIVFFTEARDGYKTLARRGRSPSCCTPISPNTISPASLSVAWRPMRVGLLSREGRQRENGFLDCLPLLHWASMMMDLAPLHNPSVYLYLIYSVCLFLPLHLQPQSTSGPYHHLLHSSTPPPNHNLLHPLPNHNLPPSSLNPALIKSLPQPQPFIITLLYYFIIIFWVRVNPNPSNPNLSCVPHSGTWETT